ncbi:hypothetical protein A5698_26905 [Mycobacterium sp. E136]|uniref:lipoprotein LpqH n=1 Tax=Mycobacterium sp. E136 TaxID=1834125 RepID=UPI0007FEECD7|nr:lipoprotein LpqH [Mycobacterium sp. E136]OBG86990.1 hypothetical protein A5698_26905 [Mycobacterium sp. E136]
MTNRSVCTMAAVLAVGLAGCSNPEPPARPPGALAPGTAEITLDGAPTETTHDVTCASDGTVMTLTTGDEESGTTTAVDTLEKPVVRSAELHNVDGFTGSHWEQLGAPAEVEITGTTFSIKGTATGFTEDNPSARVSSEFSIKVAC